MKNVDFKALYSLIELVQNSEEYEKRLNDLVSKEAHLEELTGAHNTLEKAERYLKEAEEARAEAEKHRAKVHQEMGELAERYRREAQDEKKRAEEIMIAAKARAHESLRKEETINKEFTEKERELKTLSASLSQREAILRGREEAVKEEELRIKRKIAEAQSLFA